MTPYAHVNHAVQPDVYKFSDNSQIGQVKKSDGNSSNYRFFRIEPIKWIILNYNYLPAEYGTGGDGTHNRLELLANDTLVSGVAPDKILWENNTINKYLNNTFNKEAFPMTLLVQSTIYNNLDNTDSNLKETGSNNNYLTSGSNPTTQILYLLSYYEVESSDSPYITNNVFGINNVPNIGKRITNASDYAKAHHQWLNQSTGRANYWQRTTTGITTWRVGADGGLHSNENLSISSTGTRPAMHTNKKNRYQTDYL